MEGEGRARRLLPPVDLLGMTDLIYNHITARIPDTAITC